MITLYTRANDVGREALCQYASFDKASVIYHEGDSARHWYEVVSGIVRTCRFLSDGHRQLTGFFYSDDVFGVEASAYRESAEAVTNVLLRRFDSNEVAGGPSAHTDARGQVLERALESARRSIFLFGHRTAANRVAAFLITLADRSGVQSGVQLPMTRADIADHLNLTLHTVSRTISDFARRGLIASDGPQSVRILDLTGLRILAGDADGSDADLHSRRIA